MGNAPHVFSVVLPVKAGVAVTKVPVAVFVNRVSGNLELIRVDGRIGLVAVFRRTETVAVLIFALACDAGVEDRLNFRLRESAVEDFDFVYTAVEVTQRVTPGASSEIQRST
jgi:hypothetical protein